MSLLIAQLAQAAAECPDLIAISTIGRAIAYGELPLLAAVAANQLTLIDSGARPIAILLPDGIDWIIAHLGARQLGRTTISVSGNLCAADLRNCLEALGASMMVTPSGVERLHPIEPHIPVADALIQIVADDLGRLDFAAFSEAGILRARCGPDRGMPPAISEFYAHTLRRETCGLKPWLSAERFQERATRTEWSATGALPH